MDYKQIKKSNTLTGLVGTLILAMFFFTGMFLYWQSNANNAGITIESKYNQSYGNITSSAKDLSNNVNDIKNNLKNITEADNTFQVAWNGLKGLGNALKLPISFVSTSLATYTSLEFALDYIPQWVRTFTFIGITAIVVFLVLSIMKGDPKL